MAHQDARGLAVALTLTALCTGCAQSFSIPVHPPQMEARHPSFSWDGDPARRFDVFRCAAECPEIAALPGYLQEDSPTPGVPMWSMAGTVSPHAGEGSMTSPIIYSVLPDRTVTTTTEPVALTPGNYLVRVVTMEKLGVNRAAWGTGWSTFTIPEPSPRVAGQP